MNSLQDVMKKVQESDELKAQFIAAVKEGQDATVDFMKAQGCIITKEELMAALSKSVEDRELTPAEVEFVSGGSKSGFNNFIDDTVDFFGPENFSSD